MADEQAEVNGETGGDDAGWNCSLCTYKNSPDKFKCEVCDCRRGTSTRKPRGSTDTIVAQVMKQQEQIRQQTRAKPSPKNKTGTSTPTLGSSQLSNDPTKLTKKSPQPKASNSSVPLEGNVKKVRLNAEEQFSEVSEGSESDESSQSRTGGERQRARAKAKHSAKRPKKASSSNRKSKSTKKVRPAKVNITEHSSASSSESDDDYTESDCTSVASDSMPSAKSRRVDENSSESSADDRSAYSSASSPTMTPEPTTSSPNHASLYENRPIEINGNLIKYTPPTSTGRTGLIIDKKKFTQHSITVDDVTITFTEFATRQNRYIRKKKKRSRTKSAPAPPAGAIDAE